MAAGGCGMPWSTGQRILLAATAGSGQLVVLDVTDVDHAKTLCSLPIATPGDSAAPLVARFAGPGKVAYVSVDGTSALHLLDLTSGQTKDLAPPLSVFNPQAFAISADGGSVAYLAEDASGVSLHLIRQGQDTRLAAFPPIPAADWFNETPPFWVAFSADGTMVAVLNEFAGSAPTLEVRRLDGTLAYSALGRPYVAIWNGVSLYFNYAGDPQVYRWTGAVRGQPAFVTKGPWIAPFAGHGGRFAYHWRDSNGAPRVSVVDDAGRQLAAVPAPYRRDPVFIGDNVLWYAGEKPCGDACGPFPEPDGKTYVFDVTTGTESPSALTQVYDVWPRPDA